MFKKIALLSGVLVLSGFTVYNVFSNVKKVGAVAPCIITISGVQYDVAPLMAPGAHAGGNVFVCGTDMTSLFMSVPSHATDIARMSPYIYVAPTVTPTTVPTASPTATPSPTVTPSPTTTPVPSVSPTATPSPSVSPIPHHDDDENEIEENDDHDDNVNEDKHEDKEHEDKKDDTRNRGKSDEHASEQGIASRNEHSQHRDD